MLPRTAQERAPPPVIILALLLGLVAGVLIGAIGIGGVILPPGLMLLGLDAHLAAGTSSFGFLLTGVVGTWAYARSPAMSWRMVWVLAIGVVPGAVAGALLNSVVPPGAALLPLAGLALAAGVSQTVMLRARPARSRARTLPPATLMSIGVVVGLCSAVTGTGGPLILVPILLVLGAEVMTAVAVAQAVQIPLVVFASAGYAAHGAVDLGLGSLIGCVAAVGVVFGARFAQRRSPRTLRGIAAACLLAVGCGLAIWSVCSPG